ncbi:MAG: M14 family zinc carboxypeptidase [Bryobacteraceae bacterium]
MAKRLSISLLFCWVLAWGAAPTPKEHFGYEPGADYKLADYGEIIGYFQKLDQASPRLKLVEFGRSAHGKSMYLAVISSEENLRQVERYREISRRLALGEGTPEEAARLAGEGKAIVWIDSGLHASEVAPAQHAPELAYRMVAEESAEIRRIRENVILLQIPVINPDGLDWIAHWYRNNVGSRYELAPLPWLYQKYAGHDNNRDWFMMNLEETRHVTRLLYEEWFPQIVYNQHQAPAFPARIFVPPYAEPLNPHIPAEVMEGINLIGSAMKERFAREQKPGVLSYFGYDAWWNGGLRSTPAFHNMHGILTETALHSYGTPRVYRPTEFPERFGNGIPTREPSVFYQRPWMGGKWGTREAIEYMLTADFAILDLAAERKAQFLLKAHELARRNIELGRLGKPFAYVVPARQWDASSAREMLRRLMAGGIEVRQARADFQAGSKRYAKGDYVLLAGQAFRPYLVDLMEPQKYPELKAGTDGPTKRPYDVAGWTLPMQMGVQVERVEELFEAALDRVAEVPLAARSVDHRENASFLTMAEQLARGGRVGWGRDGAILLDGDAEKAQWELRTPRVALYEPHQANMDAGWTQWLLDYFKIPHVLLKNDEVRKGDLRSRFDAIILAHQSAVSILHGARDGERPGGAAWLPESVQRPEYTGGIGVNGLAALEEFVREGGSLLAFDGATELPVRMFPTPVRAVLPYSGESSQGYYCPGSLLRITVDTSHPLAFGMPAEAIAMSTGGQAFDVTLLPDMNRGDREVRSVARYANSNLLASGWISGERAVAGRSLLVEARHGKGRVVLFGFRPQFRGQSFGTFKFVLNAIYLASAERR